MPGLSNLVDQWPNIVFVERCQDSADIFVDIARENGNITEDEIDWLKDLKNSMTLPVFEGHIILDASPAINRIS